MGKKKNEAHSKSESLQVATIQNSSVAKSHNTTHDATIQNFSVADIQKSSVAAIQNFSVTTSHNTKIDATIENSTVATIQNSSLATIQMFTVADIQNSCVTTQPHSKSQKVRRDDPVRDDSLLIRDRLEQRWHAVVHGVKLDNGSDVAAAVTIVGRGPDCY